MSFDSCDNAVSVYELNRYVKTLMDNDALLSAISVKGEISNLKYHSSGHIYFTLKDEDAEIPAVMFRSSVMNMQMVAKDGMQVIAYGRVSVYEKSGKCQMYVSAMIDNGIGNLRIEYERLLKKLTEEGLFDSQRKKKIPKIPKTIGIITSPTGAAVRDMINVTGRRWPNAKILLYPALVQGDQAPESLCVALDYFNAMQACDVIIIGRGGGSIEDLWAFNDERVVRKVAASDIPIISAVGHETDFTLCDFAADLRAPTPSAAAELAVPDKYEMSMRIDELFGRIDTLTMRVLNKKKNEFALFYKQLENSSPTGRLALEKSELAHKKDILDSIFANIVGKKREELSLIAAKLSLMNPLAVLGRGYSMVQKDMAVVSSVSQLSCGDSVSIRLSDGSVKATVDVIENK